METLKISISDDRLVQLREKAARLRISPEDLVRVSIDELLARPDKAFEDAIDYVLTKNADLYRRLV